MELNDSSTCLIHGQYTNVRMGDAKHITPVVVRKPYNKEAEEQISRSARRIKQLEFSWEKQGKTIEVGYGWGSEMNAFPEQSQSPLRSFVCAHWTK